MSLVFGETLMENVALIFTLVAFVVAVAAITYFAIKIAPKEPRKQA